MFFADFDHYIPKKIALNLGLWAVVKAPGKHKKYKKMGRGQTKDTKFITVGLLFKLLYFIRLK